MDYQEPTTTKPNFVSRQSLHVKVDEITMKLESDRDGPGYVVLSVTDI